LGKNNSPLYSVSTLSRHTELSGRMSAVMTDHNSPSSAKPTPPSPRSASLPRLANSKLFLPLTGDSASAISTRGQHLPSLFHTRRPSTIRSNERRNSLTDDEEDIDAVKAGLMMPYDRDPERRSSNAASILNTPQMRSQRLIGNSNPRYKW
jgi:hypothetical protein